MKITGTAPRVVALWGAFNGVLVLTLIGFGEQTLVMALAASMVGLVFIIAAATRLSIARHPVRRRYRQPAHGDSVVIFALGVLVAGLGLAYYPYLAIIAVIPFTMAALRELTVRQERT